MKAPTLTRPTSSHGAVRAVLASAAALLVTGALLPASASASADCMGYTANVYTTTNGPDYIVGRPGVVDVVAALGGDDVYVDDGAPEGDIVCLGDGNDQLTNANANNSGNDRINGGPGNDVLVGFQGHDAIQGNDGDDQIFGNDGDDTLDGGPANDYIVGNSGNDSVTGSGGPYDHCFGEFNFTGCEYITYGG
jgi:Ca2+-binding RTX toxin-like protein